MSKAFTREETAGDDDDAALPQVPAGTRNYITPAGYARLRSELLDLIDVERPKVVDVVHWAASNGDRSENGDYLYGKRRLREIDRRIRFLTKRLEVAELTDPSVHHGNEQVFFGAEVTYIDEDGMRTTIVILGIDEADSARGEVTWVSPIARTLLKARVGDVLRLVTPGGTKEIEVVGVRYPKGIRTARQAQLAGRVRFARSTDVVRFRARSTPSRWVLSRTAIRNRRSVASCAASSPMSM